MSSEQLPSRNGCGRRRRRPPDRHPGLNAAGACVFRAIARGALAFGALAFGALAGPVGTADRVHGQEVSSLHAGLPAPWQPAPPPAWWPHSSAPEAEVIGRGPAAIDFDSVLSDPTPPPPASDAAQGRTATAHAPAPAGGDAVTYALGFSPPPVVIAGPEMPSDEATIYDDRYPVPTERPWIEWFKPFYGDGMLPPGGTLLGETNLTHPSFYVYGDYRTGIGTGQGVADRFDNWAHRLNLDLDWQWTATERLHAFVGPLNDGVRFTQVRVDDGRMELDPVFNPNLVTAFFEGDVGSILGGFSGTPAEFELPIAAGLVPLLYQNGIWMEDAVAGVSVALPARHSRRLNWSNYDATAFAIFDQVNSPAFGTDNHAAQALGTAWFIDAYGGYIETGWAYIHDTQGEGRSYHNATAAFTRRYFDRISNSVRVIINAGQSRAKESRTADGGLLILENSLITAAPLTCVPYMNLFYGWGRPQSVARAVQSGGILRNVGINFETDGLNGYPTLDDSGNNTFGGAIGLNLLGADLDRQWVLEAAYLNAYGSAANRLAAGDQYALGMRYQFPLSYRTLVRFDTMYGWRSDAIDVYGARAEFRWKF